jgi:hypothetical protein
MPCAKLPIKPEDVATRSLPYGALTSIPAPHVPDEAGQIAIGKESSGNPVIPETAEQTAVQDSVRLWPTVKAPEDAMYTNAVPLPPWRLAVAALVTAYTIDPTLTLQGVELEQPVPIVRTGPLTLVARLFNEDPPEEPDPLVVPCRAHTFGPRQKYRFDPATALFSKKPSPDIQVEGSAPPARSGLVYAAPVKSIPRA